MTTRNDAARAQMIDRAVDALHIAMCPCGWGSSDCRRHELYELRDWAEAAIDAAEPESAHSIRELQLTIERDYLLWLHAESEWKRSQLARPDAAPAAVEDLTARGAR